LWRQRYRTDDERRARAMDQEEAIRGLHRAVSRDTDGMSKSARMKASVRQKLPTDRRAV